MSVYTDIAFSGTRASGGREWSRLQGASMGYDEANKKMRVEIGRTTVERVFESLVSEITGLVTKLTLEIIGEHALIGGLEVLIPRLRRFAPGGPAGSRSAGRWCLWRP